MIVNAVLPYRARVPQILAVPFGISLMATAIFAACGRGGATTSVPTATLICESNLAPRCDANATIRDFILVIQGPAAESQIDLSSARATLTTLDEAQRLIQSAGAETLSHFADMPTSDQVWLIEVHGEFVLPQFRSVGVSSSPSRPGLLYGVAAVNSGALVQTSFLADQR
jgi:hypothetical protein